MIWEEYEVVQSCTKTGIYYMYIYNIYYNYSVHSIYGVHNSPAEWNAWIAEGFSMAGHSVYGENFVSDLISENIGAQSPSVWSIDKNNSS